MKAFYNSEIVDVLLKTSSEGIMLLDDELNIIAKNERAVELFGELKKGMANLQMLGRENAKRLVEEGSLTLYTDKEKNLLFRLFGVKSGLSVVRISDITDKVELNEELLQVKQMNQELQELFQQYDENTIFVTDGDGNILYAGADCARNCGITLEEMYDCGTVQVLEERKIFKPSISLRVLQSHNIEVAIQKTLAGHECMAIGIPVFNSEEKLISIVSLSRDVSAYIRLGKMFSSIKKKEASLDVENKSILYPDLITSSPKFLSIIEVIKLVAPVNSTVLITGETGTGKDVVARVIHKMSTRSDKKFVKVNCGAIAPNLVESELFGYEKGSFTGARREGKIGLIESANGGTLFLDEISELPLEQQVKLLQVLQEKKMTRVGGVQEMEVDVRFLAACNKDLAQEVKKKRFREDLYYRLNVLPISLPPLRERKEDIPLLIKHFLKRFNESYRTQKEFTSEAMRAMVQYDWPGNVRELEHMVERLAVMSKKMLIGMSDLPDFIREKAEVDHFEDFLPEQKVSDLSTAVANLEKRMIKQAMEQTKNASEAAKLLGVDQSTISRKIKKYKL